MTDDDRAILNEAIDRVAAELHYDDLPAFGGNTRFRGLSFSHLTAFTRKWRRSRQCIFPDCRNISIRASHTIQAASLRQIAENSILLTPGFDLKQDRPVIREVGVGEASTFPGFCEQHEKAFNEFEQHGGIITGRHGELQIFRTICRELVAKRHEVQYFDKVIAELESLLHAHFMKRLLANLNEEFLARNQIFEITVIEGVSRRIEGFKEFNRRRKKDLDLLENDLVVQAAEVLEGNDSGLLWIKGTLIPKLPVALAGFTCFHVDRFGVSEEVPIIMHAIPGIDGTDVMIAMRQEQEDCFGVLLQGEQPSPERLVALLEEWMIYGTDNWFVTPSFWKSLPESLQEQILRDFWESPPRQSFTLNYRIFNVAADFFQ